MDIHHANSDLVKQTHYIASVVCYMAIAVLCRFGVVQERKYVMYTPGMLSM